MSKWKLCAAFALVAAFAIACGGSPTPAIPTVDPSAATVEPSVTPNDEMADDGQQATDEATSEAAAEETQQPIAGSAEGTPEVAADPAFLIEVSGDTELTINSDDNAIVVDEVVGSPAQGEEAPIMTTPNVVMRTLTFMTADQSYIFELSFSENTISAGTYEIGVDNVGTTVGNNVNENASGNTQSSVSGAESTAEADSDSQGESGTGSQGNTTPQATQVTSSGGEGAGSALNTNDPPSNAPDGGVIETDELLPPIIAARLEPEDTEATSYNLLLSGSLTIDSIGDAGVSGSFEFQLAPADNPEQTITVTGTFTDIPFSENDDETLTPVP